MTQMTDEFKRDYLPISSISLLGSCETKFLQSALGELEVTPVMQIGKEKHAELIEGLPTISREETIKKIKSGKRCAFREVGVLDKKLKIIGRVDEIQFTGKVTKGKNDGILIDDKYPVKVYISLPLSYKLQLAAYTAAIHNSEDFSKVCRIVQAKLVCRNKADHSILKTFDVDYEELGLWEKNVGDAVKIAWKIFESEKPQHRRFDIVNKEWLSCWCDSNSASKPVKDNSLGKFF